MMLISSNFLLGFVTQKGENIENILVTAIHFLSLFLSFLTDNPFWRKKNILMVEEHLRKQLGLFSQSQYLAGVNLQCKKQLFL